MCLCETNYNLQINHLVNNKNKIIQSKLGEVSIKDVKVVSKQIKHCMHYNDININ